MKFEEALIYIRQGKKVKLPYWTQNHTEMFNENMIYATLNEIIYGLWEIVEEPGKTFDQVFEAFKEGKSIRRKSWPQEFYISLHRKLHNLDNIGELLASDWEILE